MKIAKSSRSQGSTLVATIVITATLLVLLGVAIDYTIHVSRNSQRSRKTALAMEIADGHLETLFTNWRNIYRTTWSALYTAGGTDTAKVGTNYFYTAMYSGSPSPTPIAFMNPSGTPPQIPLPARTNFPTEPNYVVNQYRIQAVDPMITLDANGNALVETTSAKSGNAANYAAMSTAAVPPPAYGPNLWQYSYFYLAAVDVTVPALAGNVTAKVRRVFEKRFDQPWTYGMFYVDDLEFQPDTAFSITGPIHTNSALYIGTSNFTATGAVEYGSDYVNGFSPKDGSHSGTPTAPNFAKSDPSLTLSDCPPAQVSPFLPFGWNLATTSGATYHKIIEQPPTGGDPSGSVLAKVRYYNQAGYRVIIDSSNNITVTKMDLFGNVTTCSGNELNTFAGNNGNGNSAVALIQGKALYDAREGGAVKVTDLDVSKIISAISAGNLPGWTGLLFIADQGAATYNANGSVVTPSPTPASVTIGTVTTTTTRRAIRIVNATSLPSTGLTLVSPNPVYIQGNYNTGGNTPPSNSGTYTSSVVSGYTKRASAIVADAVTVLSTGWSDANSTASTGIAARAASANITVNAALVSGNVPSNGTRYSGGGENFIRLLEDWSNRSFCYYGSLVQLYASNQAIGAWNGDGSVYVTPTTRRLYYDDVLFSTFSPPGTLTIAAYLQQQRWYQVY